MYNLGEIKASNML